MMLAQVKTSCLLRRLMMVARRRRMMMRFDYNCYIHTTPPPTSSFTHLQISSHTFNSIGGGGGLKYEWSAKQPRCMYYHSEESKRESECDSEKENIIIKQGDVVDISQLLFTKHRDYLIRYNDPKPVTAQQLAGKCIVIFFVPLYRVFHPNNRLDTESLKDIYNDLKCKNCFEVVMVVDDDTSFDGELGQLCPNPLLQGKFDKILSKTPSWAAIPFSDITSRRRLKSKFGHFGRLSSGYQMVLIDSRGMVVDTSPQKLFHTYGSEAYPFSDTRLAFLKSKDKTAFSQRSLKEFLGSSERDFVITNKGEEVPLHTLEDKVVALYFYEDGVLPDFLTRKLMMYYEELKKNQNFEVVLLYLYDTRKTIHSTEEKFQKTFGTMPWLALPYKDLVHKKLKRLFGYPDDRLDNYGDSHRLKLVIVGPRINIIGCRDVIEPGATTILRGYDGNLFMHEEFDKVEGERVSELKLEMLCSPNTIFKRRDGSQIQFSQLLGKRIIFLFEGDYPDYDGSSFRESLKSTYMRHKGTADEFEVIYFTNNKEENSRRIADMPWFISCAVELLPGCSAILSFYGNCYHRYHSSLVLAFGRDGTVVRRSICPRLGNDSFPYYDRFPFYADGVDTEAFDIERSDFCWGYWDTLYQGLLRDSRDQIKFPSANHLFCVYYY